MASTRRPRAASHVTGHVASHVASTARAVATRLRLSAQLRALSLPELLESLGAEVGSPAPVEVVERALSASQRIVGRLRLAPDTCLYRSLARYSLLRRAGHSPRFVMALDPQTSALEGHAWIELDGRAVGETVDPQMAVTFSYPEPKP